MTHVKRFDHVGVTVADLESACSFFVALGLEVEGTGSVEGAFVEAVCGLPGARCDIVMLRSPGDGFCLELPTSTPLVAGVGSHEDAVRMAHVRGPEGVVVSLFEMTGAARE